MLPLTCNVGVLLAFLFGNYLEFFATPKIVIALTAVCAFLLFSLPESPSVLIKQKKTSVSNNTSIVLRVKISKIYNFMFIQQSILQEAEKSIQFYQNLNVSNDRDFKYLQTEINRLQYMVANCNEDKTSDNSFKWSELFVAPGKKAMLIGIVLVLLNQFCGCIAMLNYTAKIFKDAGSNMDPNMSAIVVGFIQLIGSYVASVFVDRAGRKVRFFSLILAKYWIFL